MSREVFIEKSTYRSWTGIPHETQTRLKSVIEEVARTEQPTDHSKVTLLTGPTQAVYRIRLGNYRVVCTTEGSRLLIHKVGKRGSVYQNINNTYEQVGV